MLTTPKCDLLAGFDGAYDAILLLIGKIHRPAPTTQVNLATTKQLLNTSGQTRAVIARALLGLGLLLGLCGTSRMPFETEGHLFSLI